MRRRKAEKDSSARTRGKKKKKGKRTARCACPISHTFGGCLPSSNLSLSLFRARRQKKGEVVSACFFIYYIKLEGFVFATLPFPLFTTPR